MYWRNLHIFKKTKTIAFDIETEGEKEFRVPVREMLSHIEKAIKYTEERGICTDMDVGCW